MRPVNKWAIGHTTQGGTVISAVYPNYHEANPLLQENLGTFCSYCEVFSSDLEVEHVISQHQTPALSTSWANFLVACGKCNGKGNKENKAVELNTVYLPHRNNTLYIFLYKEGGLVELNPNLNDVQRQKAQALLDLVCIDKYLGNPSYPKHNPNDKRWEFRKNIWENAVRKLQDYEEGLIAAPAAERIADYAHQRGFFSIWFTVFENHAAVKEQLIEKFNGTNRDCFDPANHFIPVAYHNE